MSSKKLLFGGNKSFLRNLVAYYAFENNANDIHSTNNGTLVGSPTFVSGINGQSINFNGTNNVSVPQSTDFDFNNLVSDLPCSFSFWINPTTNPSFAEVINKQNGTSFQWLIRRVNNYFAFAIFTSTGSNYKYWQFNSGTTALNTWSHVVILYNGLGLNSSANCYVNGVLTSRTTSNIGSYTKMSSTTQPLIIGKSGVTGGFYNGKIDEIAIWKDRELTATEVSQLYNAGAGKFYNTF